MFEDKLTKKNPAEFCWKLTRINCTLNFLFEFHSLINFTDANLNTNNVKQIIVKDFVILKGPIKAHAGI